MQKIIVKITKTLWNEAFDAPPTLGGNLTDIPPIANAIITRTFRFISSIATGTIMGLITGLIGDRITIN
jgi:hypothetical protein